MTFLHQQDAWISCLISTILTAYRWLYSQITETAIKYHLCDTSYFKKSIHWGQEFAFYLFQHGNHWISHYFVGQEMITVNPHSSFLESYQAVLLIKLNSEADKYPLTILSVQYGIKIHGDLQGNSLIHLVNAVQKMSQSIPHCNSILRNRTKYLNLTIHCLDISHKTTSYFYVVVLICQICLTCQLP